MATNSNKYVIGAVLSICIFAGCEGSTSLSSYARTGDTVMVALGGEDLAIVSRSDLVAEIHDSANNTVPVRVREVINVYPDPSSRLAAPTGGNTSYIGLKTAILDLVQPTSTPIPVTIATGAATIVVRKVVGGAILAHNTPIYILSGTGTVNPMSESTFNQSYVQALAPRPQVRFTVKPVNASLDRNLSSVELTIRYAASATQSLPATSLPVAVQTAHDQNLQFISRHYNEGTNNVIKVLMVNPHGIRKAPAAPDPVSFYDGMSSYAAMRFSVAWGDAILRTAYPAETLDRNVIAQATTTLAVFDTNGADATSDFQVVIE